MLLAFFVALAILVVIHEFGHFQVAKWCGVKVLRFSVGFGKPIFTKVFGKDNTEFVIAGIPLGGYVKMLDERELDEHQRQAFSDDLARAFNRQSPLKKITIVIAGPMANLLLAIFFYWILMLQGVTGLVPQLSSPKTGSIADTAGFKQGDLIISVKDKDITTWQDFQWELLQLLPSNQAIKIKIQTMEGQKRDLMLDLSKIAPADLEENIMQKIGFSIFQADLPAVVGEIQPNSAASRADLRAGDHLVAIDGESLADWKSFVDYIRSNPNKTVAIELIRDDNKLLVTTKLDQAIENKVAIGRLGVSPLVDHEQVNKMLIIQHYGPFSALVQAINKTWQTSTFTVKMLGKMITGNASLKSVSGPVTIANFAGQSAHLGWKPYVAFLAILSISLGVLNLLPIPVLDGGHIVYYTVEVIRGRPVSEKLMLVGQKVGFVILGALFLLAIYNDFNRLLTGSF